jgi:hypothetical protein
MGSQGLIAKGVPPQPSWIIFLRIAILVLSVILLGLGAWNVSTVGSYGAAVGVGAGGMVIFVTIFSFIVYGGATAIEMFAPHLFYRVAFLVGYILSIIFWLSAWAWSASWASLYLGTSYYYYGVSQFGVSSAACAGLGAVVWVLTIVNLAFFIKACLAAPNDDAELGHVSKPNEVPAAYPAAPQQQYAQQPQQPQGYPAQQPVYGGQQPYATQ